MGTVEYYCGEELLSLHKKDNEYSYTNKDELKVEIVKNGIIYPLEISETGIEENNQYGGVCDENNNFVELSKNTRINRDFHLPYPQWYVGANPNVELEKIEYIDEDVVFIGAMHGHFGHFLFESLNRLWFFLNNENKKYKAAYIISNTFPNKKQLDMLKIFGLKEENLIQVNKPVRFKNVIVPEVSYSLNDKCHKKYRETIEKIKENVIKKQKKIKVDKKIFFSKEFIGNSRAIGEEKIALEFKRNGYKIVHPEKLGIYEYILLLSQCKSLVCTSATNAHNCIFLPNNSEIIVLNRSNHIHYIQTMIEKLFDFLSVHIQCHQNLLPVSYCQGPFLISPTKYLKNFFKDRKMKFNKHLELSTSDIFKFFREWANIYKNPNSLIENNKKEYIEKSDIIALIHTVLE